jgi:hypothetical protein
VNAVDDIDHAAIGVLPRTERNFALAVLAGSKHYEFVK